MRLLFLLLFFISFVGYSQTDIPSLTGRVVDTTHTLSDGQIRELSQLSEQLEQQTSAQLVTLLVPTTSPQTLEQFAEETFEKWQLGQENKDNGVLLLVALDDRAMKIEVGYGLEGQLTDLTTNEIIRHILIPAFKQQHYYEGILAANQQMVAIINGQPLATGQEQNDYPDRQPLTFPTHLIVLFPIIGLTLIPASIAYFISKIFITSLVSKAIIPLSGVRKEAAEHWLATFNNVTQEKKKKDKKTLKEPQPNKVKPFSWIKLLLMYGWLSIFNYLVALAYLQGFSYSQQQFYQLLLICLPFNLLIYQISRHLHTTQGSNIGNGGSSGSSGGSGGFSGGGGRSGGGSSGFSGGGGRSGGGGSSGRW